MMVAFFNDRDQRDLFKREEKRELDWTKRRRADCLADRSDLVSEHDRYVLPRFYKRLLENECGYDCYVSNDCYGPDRRDGGNKRCFCPSVCLSVRPSRT